MAKILSWHFWPPVVGCLLEKGLQKGESWAPQDPPYCSYSLERKVKKERRKAIHEKEANIYNSYYFLCFISGHYFPLKYGFCSQYMA